MLGPRQLSQFYFDTGKLELRPALDMLVDRCQRLQATEQLDDWTCVLVQWGYPSAETLALPDPVTQVRMPGERTIA